MKALQRHLRGGFHLALTVVMVAGFACLLALGLGPRTGWYRTLTVLSGSMTPRIPVGSVVVVTPESPTKVQVGQVVTYQIPVLDHHVISHRVVKVISGGDHPVLQTKGDANAAPDPWTFQVTDPTVWHVRAGVHEDAERVRLAIEWIAQIWRYPSKKKKPVLERSRA